MKKMIIGAIAACMAVIAGCTTPTVEEMTKLGTASGYTAAYVLNNQVKVDDATRNTIIDVMTEVEKYVPETNSTYVATWTPIAQKFVDKCVADGKITQDIADRVMKDFGYVVGLLDAYIAKKDINGNKELVDAFIHSFFSSFLTNFKPANVMSAAPVAVELDEFTKSYLEGVIK